MTTTNNTIATLTAATVTKAIKETPAATRRQTIDTYRTLFVHKRGFQFEGVKPAADFKTIKNTVGNELDTIKKELVAIAAAFSALAKTDKDNAAYLTKVYGMMKINTTNNPRFELARKEAEAETRKATEATATPAIEAIAA